MRAFVLIVVLTSLGAWAEDGVVCVRKIPPPSLEPVMTSSSLVSKKYRIRIDSSEWQVVDAQHGARFEGLARTEKHLVQVAIGRRVIASFRFTFDDDRQRELWLLEGYFTWSLSPHDCAS